VPVVLSVPRNVGYATIAVLATIAAGSYLTGRQIKLRLPTRAGRSAPPSVGQVDPGEPQPGGVDLGGRGQLPD
jgi:hypothetical protein